MIYYIVFVIYLINFPVQAILYSGVIMQAYEFSSIIEGEGVIHIPKQYLGKISSPVKIILLADEKTQKSESKKFSAIKLKTKGYKFDRDAANE